METKWGVKYPERCSDKSDRSTYRLVQRESACIIDKSYYTTLQVDFDSESDASKFLTNQFGHKFANDLAIKVEMKIKDQL